MPCRGELAGKRCGALACSCSCSQLVSRGPGPDSARCVDRLDGVGVLEQRAASTSTSTSTSTNGEKVTDGYAPTTQVTMQLRYCNEMAFDRNWSLTEWS